MSKRERIEALEARVAALEASNTPGGLGDTPDNAPGGDMCEAAHTSGLACTLDLDHDGQHVATGGPGMVLQTWTDPEPVCRACQGSGYADYAAVPCPACETVPPEAAPVPQWRARVDEQHYEIVGSRATPLEDVLMCLAEVERTKDRTALARIVAVCEGHVGDGWQADPDRCGRGPTFNAWTLLGAFRSRNIIVQSAPTPDDWEWLGVVAAAWLRSLTDGES